MKHLHIDAFSGISGDMTVGAFLDLGVPFSHVKAGLAKLGISDEYKLRHRKVNKGGIRATKFSVELTHSHTHTHEHGHEHGHGHEHEHQHGRGLNDIYALLDASGLDASVIDIAKGIFMVVAEAEAHVHGKPVHEVHFHEVGAVDSIVDIVGCALCVDYIKPDLVTCSPLTEGQGTVTCAHGVLPVPVPATAQIAKTYGIPLRMSGDPGELVTPTGAAIAAFLARSFRPAGGAMAISAIGVGAGDRDLPDRPNVLRMMVGESGGASEADCVVVETNLDDMTGEALGYAMECLFESGALDVFFTPIFMKKNRPAYKLTVLCRESNVPAIERTIFKETTGIGLRKYAAARTVLDRAAGQVETPYGQIAVKSAAGCGVSGQKPEYESVRAAARQTGASFRDVYTSAQGAR